VILLLGAGVGSVSAIFAVVDHVLLRPLPYPDADRLVVVGIGQHAIPAVRTWKPCARSRPGAPHHPTMTPD
jgi:hypothetical protein